MSVSAQNTYNQRWQIMASEGVLLGFSTRCCGMTSPLCQNVHSVIKPAEDLSASFFFSFGAASSASRLFLYSLGLVVEWKRWQAEEKTNLLLLFPASLLSVFTSRSGLIKCELYNNLILAVYDNRHKNTGHDLSDYKWQHVSWRSQSLPAKAGLMVKSCSSMLRRWLVFTFRVLVPSTTFFDRGLATSRQRGEVFTVPLEFGLKG